MLPQALLDMALDLLKARFPGLPVTWLLAYAPRLAELYHRFADPVQRAAELDALWAELETRLEQLLGGGH
jgi:hypothetical protein